MSCHSKQITIIAKVREFMLSYIGSSKWQEYHKESNKIRECVIFRIKNFIIESGLKSNKRTITDLVGRLFYWIPDPILVSIARN